MWSAGGPQYRRRSRRIRLAEEEREPVPSSCRHLDVRTPLTRPRSISASLDKRLTVLIFPSCLHLQAAFMDKLLAFASALAGLGVGRASLPRMTGGRYGPARCYLTEDPAREHERCAQSAHGARRTAHLIVQILCISLIAKFPFRQALFLQPAARCLSCNR